MWGNKQRYWNNSAPPSPQKMFSNKTPQRLGPSPEKQKKSWGTFLATRSWFKINSTYIYCESSRCSVSWPYLFRCGVWFGFPPAPPPPGARGGGGDRSKPDSQTKAKAKAKTSKAMPASQTKAKANGNQKETKQKGNQKEALAQEGIKATKQIKWWLVEIGRGGKPLIN